ncbi:MAG: hypothetical protein ACR2NF_10950 [Pirellulales bacterium]
MARQYGSKNKGFQKAHDNRRVEKIRTLLRKKGDYRKRGGPALTDAELQWLEKNFKI